MQEAQADFPEDAGEPREPIAEPAEPTGIGLKAKASEKVRELGGAARERAQQTVREVGSKARERTQERVREVGGRARERVNVQLEDGRERIATRIETAAESLKHQAEHANRLQQEAEIRVAHGMEAAAGYLHNRHSEEVAGDPQGAIRRHPVRSLLIALLAGYLLVRILR